MGRNYIRMVLFTLALTLLQPGMTAEAKTKPKLAVKKKTTTVGKTYQLKLKGVPGRAKVKWTSSKKSVVSIAERRVSTVTFKTVKRGKATVTATYKKKKYKCRITVRAKEKQAADNPVLNSSDVELYYLSEEYKDYITYDKNHMREYRFRVSGTKKEVKDWKISGENADFFSITDYGLLKMDWEPIYGEPCVVATVTAVLEDGRELAANVRGYSETALFMATVFADFVKKHITPGMTEKEKAERAAWYISTTSDYELYNDSWTDIFLKGKGDCMASRLAVKYLCDYMGVKALACRRHEAHGQTLVFADGRFYMVITGYNEPKPRSYSMYEISGEVLEKVAEENLINLDYFYR